MAIWFGVQGSDAHGYLVRGSDDSEIKTKKPALPLRVVRVELVAFQAKLLRGLSHVIHVYGLTVKLNSNDPIIAVN